MKSGLDIVILGLSVTSSWGNGHATTYRGLMRHLCARGHRVLFLERDMPWYAAHRDLPSPPYGRTELYASLDELQSRFAHWVREADLAMVGSFVPDGLAVGAWVLETARGLAAFYDIDTPATLAALDEGGAEYLSRELVARYPLYLSCTGGPTLDRLRILGSPCALPLYCSFDPADYFPERRPPAWDLGYLGTYSPDRMPGLEALLLEPARLRSQCRMVVAGPQYPDRVAWPENVERIQHIPPPERRAFYNRQRFTLNLTRAAMARAGHSPSVRLFEAAACGTPVLSDPWPGLEEFFVPGREILLASSALEILDYLTRMPAWEAEILGLRARTRALAEHTAAHRARTLEEYIRRLSGRPAGARGSAPVSGTLRPPAGRGARR